jgi:hypothetical protein
VSGRGREKSSCKGVREPRSLEVQAEQATLLSGSIALCAVGQRVRGLLGCLCILNPRD